MKRQTLIIPLLAAALTGIGCTTLAPGAAGSRAVGGSAAPATAPVTAQAAEFARASGIVVTSGTEGIHVPGEATVAIVPDMATVMTGVQTRGATAAEAQTENTRLMTAVIAQIKALGVNDRDIQTSGLSISPTASRDGTGITGYVVTNQVSVTVRDLSRVGQILDATVRAGANTAGGIRFGLSNPVAAREQATAEAVKDAQRRATTIANAAGVRLGPIVSITDETAGMPSPVAAPRLAMAAEMAAVPVSPGEVDVTGRVRVVFSIS